MKGIAMRSDRLPVLILTALAALVIISAAILLRRVDRPALEPNQTAADQRPLGRFVPAPSPKPAPQISFTTLSGKTVNLSEFSGRLVLLNLWATWCAPCRHEMPSLQRLQARFGGKLAVVPVSEDFAGQNVVAPFIGKLGLAGLKIYLDPKSAVSHAFKIDGLPTTFVIDPAGRVLGRVEGEAAWDSPEMLAVLEPLLRRDGTIKASLLKAHP